MARTPRTTPVLKPDPPPAPKYQTCQYCPKQAVRRLVTDDTKDGIPVCEEHGRLLPTPLNAFWSGRR